MEYKEIQCLCDNAGGDSDENEYSIGPFKLMGADGDILYLFNGLSHKDDGPSYTSFHDNGNIFMLEYKIHGKYHNENGPAYSEYNEDGSIITELYCLNGKLLSLNDYQKQIATKLYW